jgi:ribA/ribD-fused uncharacterized protein
MQAKMSAVYFCSHNPTKYATEKWRHVLSQWHKAGIPFIGEQAIHDLTGAISEEDYNKYINGRSINTREEWMMLLKALIFAKGKHRENNLNVADQIIQSKDPGTMKDLGREITGYDETIWNQWKIKVVENGNYLQFSQNEEMKKILLETGNRKIFESSSYDAIWGIGLGEEDAKITDESEYGLNLLGESLMKVRDILSKE